MCVCTSAMSAVVVRTTRTSSALLFLDLAGQQNYVASTSGRINRPSQSHGVLLAIGCVSAIVDLRESAESIISPYPTKRIRSNNSMECIGVCTMYYYCVVCTRVHGGSWKHDGANGRQYTKYGNVTVCIPAKCVDPLARKAHVPN